MRIPTNIKILYTDYKVRQEENLHDEDCDLFGTVDNLSQVIILNTGASEEQKKATLVHELIHVMDNMFSIGLEEVHVERLGTALYTIIKDNPDMFVEQEISDDIDKK